MIILKFITIILNILFALLVAYFLGPLKWRNEDDRPSIVGFWCMVVVYGLNIFLLMVT